MKESILSKRLTVLTLAVLIALSYFGSEFFLKYQVQSRQNRDLLSLQSNAVRELSTLNKDLVWLSQILSEEDVLPEAINPAFEGAARLIKDSSGTQRALDHIGVLKNRKSQIQLEAFFSSRKLNTNGLEFYFLNDDLNEKLPIIVKNLGLNEWVVAQVKESLFSSIQNLPVTGDIYLVTKLEKVLSYKEPAYIGHPFAPSQNLSFLQIEIPNTNLEIKLSKSDPLMSQVLLVGLWSLLGFLSLFLIGKFLGLTSLSLVEKQQKRFKLALSRFLKKGEAPEASHYTGSLKEYSELLEEYSKQQSTIKTHVHSDEHTRKLFRGFEQVFSTRIKEAMARLQLADEDYNPENLEKLKSSLKYLADMTDQMSLLRQTPLKTEKTHIIDLKLFIKNMVDSFFSREQMQCEFILDFATPVYLKTNKDHLKAILWELFANAFSALEHTENKKLKIQFIEAENLKLSITDNGIGFEKSELENQLTPFTSGWRDGKAHMGLGLFKIRHELEKLGGQLSFDSIRGEGTTAILTLDLNDKLNGLSKEEMLEAGISSSGYVVPQVKTLDLENAQSKEAIKQDQILNLETLPESLREVGMVESENSSHQSSIQDKVTAKKEDTWDWSDWELSPPLPTDQKSSVAKQSIESIAKSDSKNNEKRTVRTDFNEGLEIKQPEAPTVETQAFVPNKETAQEFGTSFLSRISEIEKKFQLSKETTSNKKQLKNNGVGVVMVKEDTSENQSLS